MDTSGEVMRYGVRLLNGARSEPVETESTAAPNYLVDVSSREIGDGAVLPRLDRNPLARRLAGDAARRMGNVAGLARGGLHAAEGLVDGAVFLGRLANPLDQRMSAPGHSAIEQLAHAGRDVVDYVSEGIADPQRVVRDVRAKTHQMRIDLDPAATPIAPTISGELRRNFDIGQNQGELAFDAGSLLVGGPLAKGMKELGGIAKVGKAEKYIAQGHSPKVAAHLAALYPASAMGSHFIPRSYRLPKLLGGGPLRREFMDGPFNRLAPEGISRGDMYELHYMVDSNFHGARLPKGMDVKGWSGRALGLKKYSPAGRIWHGAPAPLKARAAGLSAVSGAAIEGGQEERSAW